MGTIVYVDGFDDYTAAQAVAHGWSAAFTSMQPGRVAGQKARISTNSNRTKALDADARYTVECAVWVDSSAVPFVGVLRFLETATVHGALNYNGDGTFSVLMGTTVLATSANLAIAANTAYHIGFDYNVHDTTGSYELRVNGVAVIGPTTGVDTRNGGAGVINNLQLQGTQSQAIDWDDMVATKGGGFQGDCRVITQMPDADATNTDWSPVGIISPIAPQATTAPAGNTGGLNVAWPAHQIHDLGLLIVESCGGEPVTLTTPAGFVAVSNSPQATGAGTAGTQLSVYWCRATSNAMPTPLVADAGDHVVGALVTFRGVRRGGNPISVTAGGVKAGATTSLTATGLTTTEDGQMVVIIATHDLDNSGAQFSAWSNAGLASITELVDAGATSGNGGGIAVAYGIDTTAGATGDTTATVTSSVNAFVTLALQPQIGDFGVVDDEAAYDGDGSYITSGTPGHRETFSYPDLGVTGTVRAVAISHVSRKDDAGTRKIATSIRRASSDYEGTPATLSTDYAAYQEIYEEDPATSDGWHVGDINSGEFGIYLDT